MLKYEPARAVFARDLSTIEACSRVGGLDAGEEELRDR